MHIFEAWFFIDRNKQNIVKIKRSPNRKKSLHKNNQYKHIAYFVDNQVIISNSVSHFIESTA